MVQQRRERRHFTPEQKFDILKSIESDIKLGMTRDGALKKADIGSSIFSQWRRQLQVGVKSSLRNGRSPEDKEKAQMRREIEKLKEIVLSQSEAIAQLKKETSWG